MPDAPISPEAREAMVRARGLAITRGRDRADLHEILLALLEAPAAGRILTLYGIDTSTLRASVEHLGRAIPALDRDAEERAVELAGTEARRLGQAEVGSEHLLLALVRQPDSLGGGVLHGAGVCLDSAREAVRFLHGLVPDWDPPRHQGIEDIVSEGSFDLVTLPEAIEGWPIIDPVAYEAMDRLRDAALAAGEDPNGELRSVIGIGQSCESSGVVVELIALESRSHLAILHWFARPLEPRTLGSPDVSIRDDVGTQYRPLEGGSAGGEHGMRGEVIVLPAPPESATMLSIEFRSFGREDLMPSPPGGWPAEEPVDGQWRFEVPPRPARRILEAPGDDG